MLRSHAPTKVESGEQKADVGEDMKTINILGSGPSGLSAAIILAKAGYEVNVYERNEDVGKRFYGDLQGLENWTSQRDVVEDLKRLGIEVNFDCDPFSKVTFSDGVNTINRSFEKPVFYLVKRGSFKGSLDSGLKDQAVKFGVKLHFKTSMPESKTDIVATGPIRNKIFAVDKGIIFKTKMPDMAVVLLNNKAAYKGYAYLLVIKGYGCMCSMVVSEFNRLDDCFEETKRLFSKIVDLDISHPKMVRGVGCFSLANKFKENETLFVGESAGIQDFFAGFGIRSAIISGYLAAQSIINNKNYEKTAKKYFKNKLKAGLVMRFIWEKFNSSNCSSMLEKIREKKNIWGSLFSYYNFNFIERLIYPIAWTYMKIQSRI